MLTSALWQYVEAWLTPEVPTIGLDKLREGMAPLDAGGRETEEDSLLLVDVRGARESAVSVIPGAITRAQYEKDPDAYAGRCVVPYCTVGFRSARYTDRLIRRGVSSANFRGSIMAWAGAGLPLVTVDGQPTLRLHTWSSRIRAPEGYLQVVD